MPSQIAFNTTDSHDDDSRFFSLFYIMYLREAAAELRRIAVEKD
jgi:hypothetical protein